MWLYFLATSGIPADADADALGLHETREKLRFMQMSSEEQVTCER